MDKKPKTMGIPAAARNAQKELREQLKRVMLQEELKIIQRYKDKEIIDGDGNTRYYHARVNGRRRKQNNIPRTRRRGDRRR